jgi:hypothetical protein
VDGYWETYPIDPNGHVIQRIDPVTSLQGTYGSLTRRPDVGRSIPSGPRLRKNFKQSENHSRVMNPDREVRRRSRIRVRSRILRIQNPASSTPESAPIPTRFVLSGLENRGTRGKCEIP